MNEILLGKFISTSNTFPAHFRSYESSPETKFYQITSVLDKSVILDIHIFAMEMSSVIKGRLIQDGYMANTVDVKSVTWTSNPSDHEALIGVKDENTTADIIIHTISGNYVGISAKYGKSSSVTLKNLGLSTMHSIVDSKVSFDTFVEQYFLQLKTLGLTGSQENMKAQYKELKKNKDQIAKRIDEMSKALRQALAFEMVYALLEKSQDFIRQVCIQLLCAPTFIPHYRSHTKKTEKEAIHTFRDLAKDCETIISDFSDFEVTQNGMELTILAKRNSKDIKEEVCTLRLKHTSSPCTSIKGNVTSKVFGKK